MKTVARPPLLFRLARRLVKARIRGSSRLTQLITEWGVLNVVVNYKLGGVDFGVPLWRLPIELEHEVEGNRVFVDMLCAGLSGLSDTVLFDCGANIGIISAMICESSHALSSILAFEPNLDVFPYLEKNLAVLPVPAKAIALAVANFTGNGRLEYPSYDKEDTGRYLVPGDGPIQVTTIDSFGKMSANIAVKIDVEGGELEVLQGARATIQSAKACVIAVEAHPKVAGRTGRDPVACLQFLESIRPFRFTVAETREELSADRPVIQPGQTEVRNIVCVSA